MAVSAEFQPHPLLKQLVVEHERDDGLLLAYVPHSLIDDGDIPTDPQWVADLIGQMDDERRLNHGIGIGQREPIDLVLLPNILPGQLRNGAHRLAANKLRLGIDISWASLELKGSPQSVADGRFAASQRPELYLPRFRELATTAWSFTSFGQRLPIQEALGLFLNQNARAIRKQRGIDSDEESQILKTIQEKLGDWRHTAEEIYKFLRISGNVSPQVLRRSISEPTGKKRKEALNMGAIEAISRNLPNKPELHELAATEILRSGLENLEITQLAVWLNQQKDPQRIAEMLRSGEWKNPVTLTEFDTQEKLISQETSFVADAYLDFFKTLTQVPTSRIVSPDNPLTLLADQNNLVSMELRNRSQNDVRPYELGPGERMLLPLDLSAIRGLDTQPKIRHARATTFLGLLGINTDLSFLDGLDRKNLDDGQIAIRLAHEQRPLTVWGVGSTKNWVDHLDGISLDKLWVVYSENFQDQAMAQKNRKKPAPPVIIIPEPITFKRSTTLGETSQDRQQLTSSPLDTHKYEPSDGRIWGRPRPKKEPKEITSKGGLQKTDSVKAVTIQGRIAEIIAEDKLPKVVHLTVEDIKTNQTYENGKSRVVVERIGKKVLGRQEVDVVFVSEEDYRGSESPIPLDDFLAKYKKATFR